MYLLSPNQTPRRGSFTSMMSEDYTQQKDVTGDKTPYTEGNLKIVFSVDLGSEILCVNYNADGTLIAAGLDNGTIKIVNPDTGQTLYSLSDEDTHPKGNVSSVKFKPADDSQKPEHQHIITATYAKGFMKFWHYTSGSCLNTINFSGTPMALSINRWGDRFAAGGYDSKINVYDMETKKVVNVMEASDSRDVMNGHRSRVFAVQFHPIDGNQFISGGWDDTIQFWDVRQKHSIRGKSIFGPHICGDGLDIVPVPGGQNEAHILTASWRREDVLQIWDYNSASLIKTVPQSNLLKSQLYCGQWLGKDNIVCGGGEQNMARVIDRGTLNTVGQLLDLPKSVVCLDNDRQARPKICIGSDTRIYVLRTEKKQ